MAEHDDGLSDPAATAYQMAVAQELVRAYFSSGMLPRNAMVMVRPWNVVGADLVVIVALVMSPN